MPKFKSLLPWIFLALVLVAGFFVGRSILASLSDTRAALARQQAIADSLQRNDTNMRRVVDSLDTALEASKARVAALAYERDSLDQALAHMTGQYARTQARLDTLWEGGAVIAELDDYFPSWRGQIREATRGDGVHALIAPRFFGANVAEKMAELTNTTETLRNREAYLANLEASHREQDGQIDALTTQRDTLQTTYDTLYVAYQDLDGRYRDLLKRKWFQLKIEPGFWTGVGLGALGGVLTGKAL